MTETGDRPPRLLIAGRDKPHRCPHCWVSHPHGSWRTNVLRRLRWWLPRHCGHCGAWTLTTYPRRIHGSNIHVRLCGVPVEARSHWRNTDV